MASSTRKAKVKAVAEVLKAVLQGVVLQEAVHQRAVLQRLLSRVQQRVLKAEHHRVQLRRIQQEKIHRQSSCYSIVLNR